MKHLLGRDILIKLFETYTLSAGNVIWIHHPITEDLISVRVVKAQKDKVLVSILEGSPYQGQPDWWMQKLKVIGIKENTPI